MIGLCPVKRRRPTSDTSITSTQKKKLKTFSTKAGMGEICMDTTQQAQVLCTADSNLDLDLEGIRGRLTAHLSQDTTREEDGAGKGCPDSVIGWCELPVVEERRVSGVWLVVRDGCVACFNAERWVREWWCVSDIVSHLCQGIFYYSTYWFDSLLKWQTHKNAHPKLMLVSPLRLTS